MNRSELRDWLATEDRHPEDAEVGGVKLNTGTQRTAYLVPLDDGTEVVVKKSNGSDVGPHYPPLHQLPMEVVNRWCIQPRVAPLASNTYPYRPFEDVPSLSDEEQQAINEARYRGFTDLDNFNLGRLSDGRLVAFDWDYIGPVMEAA